MIKRTLFFTNPYHLHSRLEQLVADDKVAGTSKTVAVEDVGFVVLEHPQITFTQGLIRLLMQHNVAVVFCDEKYLPTGMLLNLDGHQLQTARFRAQVASSEPLKKSLWQQVVKRKILNQAAMLHSDGKDHQSLIHKATKVLSGDSGNEESAAAVVYWKRLLGEAFLRDRYGDAPNALLNYGYAILRAATARALAGSGLHPTLGIFHRNQYNSFCLADDLMEPYRPFVDRLVMDWVQTHGLVNELETTTKAHLLGVLSCDVAMNKRKSPLMIALSQSSASMAYCFEGKQRKLALPEWPI